MTGKRYDAIVVGGGIAGLTATAYLAKAGRKVLLIEKNAEVGGLVNSFMRDGFHFDAGVRALLDAGIILPMLKDLGIELKVLKSPVSLGIENEILHIENLESLEAYSDLLKRFYPESGSEIDEVLRVIRRVMKQMDVLYGLENPVFMDLKRNRRYLFKKLLPWLPRFLLTIGKINRMQMPVEDYLASIVKNPSLRDIISQHFFRNTPAFFALSYFSLYLDYFYPKGGVGKLADVLKEKILSLGGEIKTGTIVNGVFPDKKQLTDDSSALLHYDKLVWAADLNTLYRISGIDKLPAKTKSGVEQVKSKMRGHEACESVFTLFLQIDEPLESFRKITNGHVFYTPSGQGLGEMYRKDLQEMISNDTPVSKQRIMKFLDTYTRLNTYEISIPGLKDGDLAPPGKTGMMVSLLAEYRLFKKIEEAGWLEEFISELESRMIKVLSDSVYPMLKEKVTGRFSFSPLSIEKRTGSSEGGIVGWAFKPNMPVTNRIQLVNSSVKTPLPSVFQAGQWTYSPAGVPMSILTGKLAADQVLAGRSRNKE